MVFPPVRPVSVPTGVELADHAYTWPDIALKPGANVVQVTGLRDGTRITERI